MKLYFGNNNNNNNNSCQAGRICILISIPACEGRFFIVEQYKNIYRETIITLLRAYRSSGIKNKYILEQFNWQNAALLTQKLGVQVPPPEPNYICVNIESLPCSFMEQGALLPEPFLKSIDMISFFYLFKWWYYQYIL